MSLLTQYPLWLAIFAVLLGVGYALFLYYKNDNIVFEKRDRIIMASLRGVAMTLLAFLLLAPMLKMIRKQTDKPVIIFAIDNSESIASGKDADFYTKEYPKQLQKIVSELGKQYDVDAYFVGDENLLMDKEKVNVDFSDKSTNLSALFDDINLLYSNRNVGAVVMLTDGIYNIGSNPYYAAQKVNFPVYTVGLGSDEQATDLFIADIIHNKEVLKGNRAPVEVKVQAGKLSGKTAKLTVSDDKGEVFSKTLQISGNQYFETVALLVDATQPGLKKFRVDLDELDGEITYKNNHAQFFIRVIESKDKIAIVYDAPHPDVAAIRSALEISDNYDITVASVDEFKANPSEFGLIVLHQLPSHKHPASSLLSQIRQAGVSSLFIIGTQTDLNAFNGLNTGLQITQSKNMTNNATASYNNNFMLFSFSEEAQQLLPTLPPLQAPFGTYKASVSSNLFMTQKISGVETKYPLFLFNDVNGAKTGVISGTGLWSWKVYDFVNTQNHDAFNEIVNKTALFLVAKNDKSPFRVHHNAVFAENAPVEFSAELYNESHELLNTPDVKLTIKGSGDTTYDAQFSKQNNAYYLNMGELPVGTYTWTAKTQLGNKTYEKSGTFSVQEIFVETANLVADFDMLKSVAQASGGKFFPRNEMENVVKEIKANDNIKPVASYQKKYSMLLNSPWYLAAIVLLLGIEWFLRKWHGGM
ncbi:MAG: hypothetical protein J6P54_10370 [Bacteroidales bacterium]|nr:hypothetical protein [Bacteroidales bacterium]